MLVSKSRDFSSQILIKCPKEDKTFFLKAISGMFITINFTKSEA